MLHRYDRKYSIHCHMIQEFLIYQHKLQEGDWTRNKSIDMIPLSWVSTLQKWRQLYHRI